MTAWQIRDIIIDTASVDDTGIVDMPDGWEPFTMYRTRDVVVVTCRRPLTASKHEDDSTSTPTTLGD